MTTFLRRHSFPCNIKEFTSPAECLPVRQNIQIRNKKYNLKGKTSVLENTHVILLPVCLYKSGTKNRTNVTSFSKLVWHTTIEAKVDTVKGKEIPKEIKISLSKKNGDIFFRLSI